MSKLTRRDILKSLGISATYSVFAPFAARLRAQDVGNIKRLVLFFTPNGTNYEDWKPKSYGKSYIAGKIFDPLKSFYDDLLIFDNIKMNVESTPSNEHQRGLAALWTNQGLNGGNAGSGFAKGLSIDQYVANNLQKSALTSTPIHSLNLTIFEGDNNQSYQSFAGNNQPVVPLYNPREAWNLLFEGFLPNQPGGPSSDDLLKVAQQQSILDFLKNDINSLKRDLSLLEQVKLSEHLEGIREIEKRVGRASLEADSNSCIFSNESDTYDHPGKSIRSEGEMQSVGKAHMDLIVEGFACDRTRVASIMWDQPAGEATFEFLKDQKRADDYKLFKSASDSNYNHHDHSHQYNDKDPRVRGEARQSLTIIQQWYMEQLNYLLTRLKDKNMLEDTLVVVGSDIAVGVHTLDDIPFVFAGGRSFFNSGIAIDGKGVSHAKILTTISHAFGIKIERFGNLDSTTGTIGI